MVRDCVSSDVPDRVITRSTRSRDLRVTRTCDLGGTRSCETSRSIRSCDLRDTRSVDIRGTRSVDLRGTRSRGDFRGTQSRSCTGGTVQCYRCYAGTAVGKGSTRRSRDTGAVCYSSRAGPSASFRGPWYLTGAARYGTLHCGRSAPPAKTAVDVVLCGQTQPRSERWTVESRGTFLSVTRCTPVRSCMYSRRHRYLKPYQRELQALPVQTV